MRRTAVFSDNGAYRYLLRRVWDPALPVLVICMLNPSLADNDCDDATIRWLIGYARKHGFGSLAVVNFFALVATDPRRLRQVASALGWRNERWVRLVCRERLVVSAWAPGNAQASKLPPCHALFVLNVQLENGKPILCLHLTQRSCDVALGVPYNIAGYAFLLELFARFADIPAGIFAHTLVDAHAYTSKPDGSKAEYDHVPGLRTQLTRIPRSLPRLKIDPSIRELSDINRFLKADTDEVMSHFVLEGYDPHPAIKFKVAV